MTLTEQEKQEIQNIFWYTTGRDNNNNLIPNPELDKWGNDSLQKISNLPKEKLEYLLEFWPERLGKRASWENNTWRPALSYLDQFKVRALERLNEKLKEQLNTVENQIKKLLDFKETDELPANWNEQLVKKSELEEERQELQTKLDKKQAEKQKLESKITSLEDKVQELKDQLEKNQKPEEPRVILTENYQASQKELQKQYPDKNTTEINISSKNLTGNLDLREYTKVKRLIIFGNQITNLDLSKCTDLEYLHCTNNQLTSLDFLKQLPNPEKLTACLLNSNNFAPTDLSFLTKFSNNLNLACDDWMLKQLSKYQVGQEDKWGTIKYNFAPQVSETEGTKPINIKAPGASEEPPVNTDQDDSDYESGYNLKKATPTGDDKKSLIRVDKELLFKAESEKKKDDVSILFLDLKVPGFPWGSIQPGNKKDKEGKWVPNSGGNYDKDMSKWFGIQVSITITGFTLKEVEVKKKETKREIEYISLHFDEKNQVNYPNYEEENRNLLFVRPWIRNNELEPKDCGLLFYFMSLRGKKTPTLFFNCKELLPNKAGGKKGELILTLGESDEWKSNNKLSLEGYINSENTKFLLDNENKKSLLKLLSDNKLDNKLVRLINASLKFEKLINDESIKNLVTKILDDQTSGSSRPIGQSQAAPERKSLVEEIQNYLKLNDEDLKNQIVITLPKR